MKIDGEMSLQNSAWRLFKCVCGRLENAVNRNESIVSVHSKNYVPQIENKKRTFIATK